MTKEIRLPAPHPLFRPRLEGAMRRSGHPGTAVRIGEDLYEIVSAEKSGEDWVYFLEPWPGEETIRGYVEWGEESERAFSAGLREERDRRKIRLLAWGIQVFLGFLPAGNQKRLHEATGLDPARATLWSAVLETAVAASFVLWFLVNSIAGRMGDLGGSIPIWAGALAFVVLADGVFRLAAVISTGEPIGSLFLAFLGLRSKSEGPRFVPGDEILEIEDVLTVISPVPKVWWERAGGVTFNGEAYTLAETGRERMKFTYSFRKGGEGFPALDPELEKARNRSSDLSYVFALLWGYLPPDLQKNLEFYGRHRPRSSAIFSIGVNFVVALAILGFSLRNVSRNVSDIWDLIFLIFALSLFSESVIRLLRFIRDGQNGGSILAFLVKPFYRLTVKGTPVERR